MKTIGASEAKAKLLGILDDVERGETFVITRHGKPIARIVPDEDENQRKRREAMDRLDSLRKTLPAFTTEEILSAIREGRKY
jgi:prevent-host-death family protein